MAETLVVEEVLKRIKQLTGDLEKIRKDYASQVTPSGASLSANNLAEVENARVIAELDVAIDDLQHVVWLYTETTNARGARNAPSESKLLSRATDILSALSARPPLPRSETGANGASFIERLMKLMDAAPNGAPRTEPVPEKPPA